MAEKPVMHQKIPLNVVPSRSMCSLKTQNIIQQTKSQRMCVLELTFETFLILLVFLVIKWAKRSGAEPYKETMF